MSSVQDQEMDPETYRAAVDAAMAPLKAPDPSEAAKGAESAGKAKKKKGKRKGKSGAARGETGLTKSRGTGFEEYYADPPITPQEHIDEQTLYSPQVFPTLNIVNPFHERIEECIQRFRARRRLDNLRAMLFTNYLLVGGINSSARQFTGVADMNEQELEGVTSSDMRAYTATDVVDRSGTSSFSRFYRVDEPDNWDVDFSGVAAGFFSDSLPKLCSYDLREYASGLEVVHNFLTYVLAHDVCPEFNDDVEKARQLCHQAAAEFPQVCAARTFLPGLFNKACGKLFFKKDDHQTESSTCGHQEWLDDDDFDAERIFKATIALLDEFKDSKILKKARDVNDIHVTETVLMDLEITEIRMPSDELDNLFGGVKDRGGKTGNIPSMGFATMRQCVIETAWDNPKPTEEELRSRPSETFIFDADTLTALQVGFKLEALVCRLDGGELSFIAGLGDVLPSFYTFLPQTLMLNFKEPVPNERPAPSVDNPEVEEDGGEMEDLEKDFGEASLGEGGGKMPVPDLKDIL